MSCFGWVSFWIRSPSLVRIRSPSDIASSLPTYFRCWKFFRALRL